MATGIFMLNLGGPKTAKDVPKYLARMFSDDTFIRIPFGLGPWIGKLRVSSV
jgi:ferrochelatase